MRTIDVVLSTDLKDRGRDTSSLFSPNAGKYGAEKLIRTLFMQCYAKSSLSLPLTYQNRTEG